MAEMTFGVGGLQLPRLIFVVSTGRSGTGYLANVLAAFPGVTARHEPQPDFAQVMRAVQADAALATRFWLEEKLPYIVAIGTKVYSETSHLFCKGFVEPLVSLDIWPSLIVLERNRRQVATSLYQLGVIPARTARGHRYLLQPTDPGVLALASWERLHDYQLCYWYCLEIERRGRVYEEMWRKVSKPVVRVSLNELRTIRGVLKIQRELRLSAIPAWQWVKFVLKSRRPVNTKAEKKGKDICSDEKERMESEVHSLIQERGNILWNMHRLDR